MNGNEDIPDNHLLDWNKLRDRLLCSKRIWKYIAFYTFVYFGSRRVFDKWYDPKYRPKVSISQPLSAMDQDVQVMQNVIGLDSHKPSSNLAMMMNQFAHCYLLIFKSKSFKKYAFNTLADREESLKPNYVNNDAENHVLDVNISIWSFLMFIDTFHIVFHKKGKINNSDKLMFFHHICGLVTCAILKYHNNGGKHWCWAAFWSEGTGILAMIASLIRVIYQKRRPDLIILRHISDIIFAINMLVFTYARVFLYANWNQTKFWWRVGVKDQYKQYSLLTRSWNFFVLSMNFVGIWWVIQSWRVIGEKVIELMKEKK